MAGNGNFSRDTFDALKHYVGVRLQQGVPLVDADWNEQEDIRRFEIQSFLKWFVGNGVPKGNDGFRIELAAGRLILTLPPPRPTATVPSYPEIEIDLAASSAGETLGFNASNWRAARRDGLRAQLIGTNLLGLPEELLWALSGQILVFRIRPHEQAPWTRFTATIEDTGTETDPGAVIAAINSATPDPADPDPGIVVSAAIGAVNDLAIKGGDGSAEGAGICLVEGYDLRNENDLLYSAQRLPALSSPTQNRTDLVYLDAWEELIDYKQDPRLVDDRINLETCVRTRRRWAVRVFEGVGVEQYEVPQSVRQAQHVYYPLALRTSAGFHDLRRTGLAILSQEITIKDGKVGIGTETPQAMLDIAPPFLATWLRLGAGGDSGRVWVDRSCIYNPFTQEFQCSAPRLVMSDFDEPPRIQFQQVGPEPKTEANPEFSSWIGHARSLSRDIAIMGGNVGIGTQTPEATLEVNGDLKIHGELCGARNLRIESHLSMPMNWEGAPDGTPGKGFVARLTNESFANEDELGIGGNLKWVLGSKEQGSCSPYGYHIGYESPSVDGRDFIPTLSIRLNEVLCSTTLHVTRDVIVDGIIRPKNKPCIIRRYECKASASHCIISTDYLFFNYSATIIGFGINGSINGDLFNAPLIRVMASVKNLSWETTWDIICDLAIDEHTKETSFTVDVMFIRRDFSDDNRHIPKEDA